MGKYSSGVNGHVRGTVGAVIGSSWKGISYLKGPYKNRTKRISKKELRNRDKFGECQYWLKPLLEFVREGFKGYTTTVEGFIAAKSYLMKNALEVNGSQFSINPALMLVSAGDLPLAADITVEKQDDKFLRFSWDSSVVEGANSKDQVMLLAYDTDNKAAFFTTTGQFRITGSDSLRIFTRKGMSYHIYFAFTAHDRSRQSNSVYLGMISY